jgi:hypothetical protein
VAGASSIRKIPQDSNFGGIIGRCRMGRVTLFPHPKPSPQREERKKENTIPLADHSFEYSNIA